MGLVLSRPSDVPALHAVPSLEGLPGADDPVFVGGRCSPRRSWSSPSSTTSPRPRRRSSARLGFMPADVEPEELSIRRLRLFAGYSGWGAGQLEAELDESSWIVVDAVTDDAFAQDPDELWRSVLHRKGGPFVPHGDHALRPGSELGTRTAADRRARRPARARERSGTGTARARGPAGRTSTHPCRRSSPRSHTASATSAGPSSGNHAASNAARCVRRSSACRRSRAHGVRSGSAPRRGADCGRSRRPHASSASRRSPTASRSVRRARPSRRSCRRP